MPTGEAMIENGGEDNTIGDVLSLVEAAQIAGLASHTLAQQAAKGTLRARKIGHFWVTKREYLDEYLRTRSRKATAQRQLAGKQFG
jgi:hypothetical protein